MRKPQAAWRCLVLVALLALGLAAQDSRPASPIEVFGPSGMEGAAARVKETYPRLLAEAEKRLGIRYGQKLVVWLERDDDDFNRRIVSLGGAARPEHVAAVAFPLHDVVVMKADAWRRGAPDAFEVTFQHEIVHCILGDLRRLHPEMELPTWLDEGIAQWVSESVFFGADDVLAQAIRRDELIPFETLRRDFPDKEGASALAYAQSLSLVRFIADRGGAPGRHDNIQALLIRLGQGQGLEEAVAAVSGLDFDALELAWREGSGTPLPFSLRQVPELVFALALLVLSMLGYAVHRVRRERRMAEFAREEAEEDARAARSRLEIIRERWAAERRPPADDSEA